MSQAASLAIGASIDFSWTIEIDTTKYADGGAYIFTIYAGADQTVPSSKQESIAIDAENENSNELDFSREVWQFVNNIVDSPHSMVADDKNALLTGLTPSERLDFIRAIAEGSNGHCFGMSLSTILSKMNIFHISEYDSNASQLRDATLTDRVWSIICYYHLLQNFKEFQQTVTEFMSMGSIDQISTIEQKAAAVKTGASPVLLFFGYKGTNGWGHAVVAYGVESDSGNTGKWNYNGKTYDHRILIYDCNFPDGNEDSCLYYNEGTDEWTIPEYGLISTDENAYLKRACNDLNILNLKNHNTNLYNYKAELRAKNETELLLESAGKQYPINAKSGEAPIGLITYYDDDISPSGGSGSVLHVVLPDENEQYTVRTASGNAEDLDFNIKYDDKYISFDASAAKEAEFSPNGSLELYRLNL